MSDTIYVKASTVLPLRERLALLAHGRLNMKFKVDTENPPGETRVAEGSVSVPGLPRFTIGLWLLRRALRLRNQPQPTAQSSAQP